MIRSRILGLAVALAMLASSPLANAAPAAASMPERLRCDFNDDGHNDIAIAARQETASGQEDAGLVQVTYTTGDWWISQNISMAIAGKVYANSYFGTALACGDYNGDGFADLAIGATGLNDGAGAVYVVFGAVGGLSSEWKAQPQIWHQDNVGTDEREAGDLFGAALASGDFDDDGIDDLAIGVPGETVDGAGGQYLSAGMVHVLPGSDQGLTAAGALTRIGECCWANTRYYGWSLATGDVDDDGRDELAIGMPGATIATHDGDMYQAGGVEVLQGSSLELLTEPVWAPEVITQLHVGDGPEKDDFFGATIVMADFDGDDDDDLAIGAPKESDGAVGAAGSVDIVVSDGGLSGFDFGESYRLTQDTPSMPGTSEVGDQFGIALASGDFDGDRRGDLAIGTRESGTSAQLQMGSFFALPGTANELDPGAATMSSWMGEKEAWLGAALATGDVTGDGRADLVVGMPRASVKGLVDAGAALVFRGQFGATVIDIQPPHVVQIDEAVANPSSVNVPMAGEYFGTAVAG